MKNVIKAIEISRPLLWLNTSMPLLWGILDPRRTLQLSDLVLFAFFLFPYNYFLHAPNDYFDFETDARNPRKGGVEGALTPKPLLAKHAIVSTLLLLPFLAFTATQFPPLTLASLGEEKNKRFAHRRACPQVRTMSLAQGRFATIETVSVPHGEGKTKRASSQT
jgi:4-hydroxybenzoate polyprenyltransferase